MNKTELITEIINLCDRAEKAEAAIKALSVPTASMVSDDSKSCEAQPSIYDLYVAEVGRKHVFDSAVRSWRSVSVSEDEKTGVVSVTPFDMFAKDVLGEVPDCFSVRDFIYYFDKELRELYEDKKAVAMAEFEEGR